MNYISAKEAAENWNLSLRRVQSYCANHKIPGAERVGKQWMIPQDALRPKDGRTREVKEHGLALPYHFPVFIHSRHFISQELLSEDEIELLDGQILYLKGKYLKSIDSCRRLYHNSEMTWVRYGAAATICYNYYCLGISSMLSEWIGILEKMLQQSIDENQAYAEDFRLIKVGLLHHISWDATLFDSINISKISTEAQLYYQSLMLMVSSFTAEQESKYALATFESLSYLIGEYRFYPTAMSMHFSLGSIYNTLGDLEKRDEHLYAACDIGINQKWYHYLAKHSFISPRTANEYIMSKDNACFKEVKSISELLISSLVLIKKANTDLILPPDFYTEYSELMHLLVCGMNDRAIADALNKTIPEIEALIKSACAKSNLKDRQAFTEYARSMLRGELISSAK